jgi:acyl carrier protein
MENFFKQVADILEVDEIKSTDVLRDLPEWDSISVLSVIAMVSSKYRINLTARDVRGASTAEDLHELISVKIGR